MSVWVLCNHCLQVAKNDESLLCGEVPFRKRFCWTYRSWEEGKQVRGTHNVFWLLWYVSSPFRCLLRKVALLRTDVNITYSYLHVQNNTVNINRVWKRVMSHSEANPFLNTIHIDSKLLQFRSKPTAVGVIKVLLPALELIEFPVFLILDTPSEKI